MAGVVYKYYYDTKC